MNSDMIKLAHFMIDIIGKNKDKAITQNGADWDYVASKVWDSYTGFFHEFMINDAIEFLVEAAESNQ